MSNQIYSWKSSTEVVDKVNKLADRLNDKLPTIKVWADITGWGLHSVQIWFRTGGGGPNLELDVLIPKTAEEWQALEEKALNIAKACYNL